jgi:hypothetical protein
LMAWATLKMFSVTALFGSYSNRANSTSTTSGPSLV